MNLGASETTEHVHPTALISNIMDSLHGCREDKIGQHVMPHHPPAHPAAIPAPQQLDWFDLSQ